jgi:transglutaminase-like putative cysteine protease
MVRGRSTAGVTMRLAVKADLSYRFDEPCEVLLLVEAARGPDQQVLSERLILSPGGTPARQDDEETGERRCVFNAAGLVDIHYEAVVEVSAREAALEGVEASLIRDLPGDTLRYLRPSRYCPSDQFEEFTKREFGAFEGGAKVEAILGWIDERLEYCAGVSNEWTTAVDTFHQGAGVCRDFAHMAVTFCRAAEIPARVVSAYAWDLDPPDLHAVAEVYLGGCWRLVDPTRKAPIEGLVRIATGRDAADIAFMTIFGEATLEAQSFSVERLEGASPERNRASA